MYSPARAAVTATTRAPDVVPSPAVTRSIRQDDSGGSSSSDSSSVSTDSGDDTHPKRPFDGCLEAEAVEPAVTTDDVNVAGKRATTSPLMTPSIAVKDTLGRTEANVELTAAAAGDAQGGVRPKDPQRRVTLPPLTKLDDSDDDDLNFAPIVKQPAFFKRVKTYKRK